jgi:hypothetical protein
MNYSEVKMNKHDSYSWTILIFGMIMLFFVFFAAVFDKYYSPKLTEQDYYNKFCTKHFDVACDNINLNLKI